MSGRRAQSFRYLREILKDDTGRAEGNLSVILGRSLPVEDGLDVTFLDGEIVTVADGGFEEHANRVRKVLSAGVTEGGEIVIIVGFTAVCHGFLDGGIEGVSLGGGSEAALGQGSTKAGGRVE